MRHPLHALLAALLLTASTIATAAEPSAAEIEFWRSTERIATPDAYRAYLAAFPNGLYAPLARAALGGAAPAAAPVRPAATTLRYFSETPDDTGAIGFNIGDRFTGPGALTFGRVGSRRQIVLPDGEWVVLAGTDWRGVIPTNQSVSGAAVSMATVVFGKFADDRLVTMLRYTANARPAAAAAGSMGSASWPDFDRCNVPANTRLFHEARAADAFRDECTSIWVAPDPLAEPWPGNAEAKQSLSRIGGVASGAAIVTTLTFAERRYGYLGIVRADWPNLGPGSEQAGAWTADAIAAVPARRAWLRSATAWAAEYRKAALEGLRNDYPGDDLKPLR